MSREEFEKELNVKMEELKKELIEKYFSDKDENTEKTLQETIDCGDKYYYVECFDKVSTRNCSYNELDEILFNCGNFYLTKEEAEFEAERRKVIRELGKYAVKNPVWCKGYQYYFIYYDSDCKYTYYHQTIYPIGDIVFESKNNLLQAITEVGVDRVEKYYLRVED